MDNQLKYSQPVSIRTAGTLNDSEYTCKHSWKCFVNPAVNLHYHQIMIGRNSRGKSQTHKILRATSCNPSLYYSTRNKSPKNCLYREYPEYIQTVERRISKNLLNQYGIQPNEKEQGSVGVQTRRVIIIEPETYEMQEEERKYLRNKFIDHYGIRHRKKF